jgi:hypothetical protein
MPGRRRAALAVAMALGVLAAARGNAGHELSFYPSFYPEEIRLSVLEPPVAAKRLQKRTLHAYIGRDPFAGAATPAHVAHASSFGSYIVLTFASTGRFRDAATRCAAAGRVARGLAAVPGEAIVHPYPVTPYHSDYLQHFDRIQAAWPPRGPEAAGPTPRLRAKGWLAATVRAAGLTVVERDADAVVEAISLPRVLGPGSARLDGVTPSSREGWVHAYRLLAGSVTDPSARRELEGSLTSGAAGEADRAVARANRARRLITLLTRGCERLTLGYTVARQALNEEYSDGVENVAYDAQAGLGSAIFFRTVKLKDFPWNGVLRVGVERTSTGAWNRP